MGDARAVPVLQGRVTLKCKGQLDQPDRDGSNKGLNQVQQERRDLIRRALLT